MSKKNSSTEQFEQALYFEAKKAFRDIMEKYGDDLYVIGFYHFGGFDSVMPMFNTRSALNANLENADHENERYGYYSHKWNPSEYPMLEQYSDYFENCVSELRTLKEGVPQTAVDWDDNIQALWQSTLLAMERVLIRLDSEGVFNAGVQRKNLTLSISTYDELESKQFDRIKRLNSQFINDEIENEFETMISLRGEAERLALDNLKFDND